MINVQGLSPQKRPPACLLSLGWLHQHSDSSALLPCPALVKHDLRVHPQTWVPADPRHRSPPRTWVPSDPQMRVPADPECALPAPAPVWHPSPPTTAGSLGLLHPPHP